MATTVTSHRAGGGRVSGFGATERRDNWWVGPLATALGLGAFGIYSTFRAVYNAEYHLGVGTEHMQDHAHLLSPFYSPLIILALSAGLDFTGLFDLVGTRRVSFDLLLLPQSLLPRVLCRPGRLWCR